MGTKARPEVLIVGAGPTGLVLALSLSRLGVGVRIIDRSAGPTQQSRALAVQARTLELYRPLDLTAEVLRAGLAVPAMNFWVAGTRRARVPFADVGAALSPYAPITLPQDRHESLLAARLAEAGVQIERRAELLDFEEHPDGVRARLLLDGQREETCHAQYLAGCDGASSRVREQLKIGFPGGTYEQLFYVADIRAHGPAMDGELHIDLDEADFLAVFPIDGPGRARLIGTVRDVRAEHPEALRFADVSDRALGQMKIEQIEINWFSTYRVHHRVAERFRHDRVFLLGDAGHIHSPAGGQGMNTGIGDAVNLAWKLRGALRGRAPPELLDSYEIERCSFARRLVASTDKAFTLATAEGSLAQMVRVHIVPRVVPVLFRLPIVREYLFSTVAQLTLGYRDSPLSVGRAGHLHGGDRLPWVPLAVGDNFDALGPLGWQLHVYGSPDQALRDFCGSASLPVHCFPWRSACERAGIREDALYLIRPDTYLGLVQPRQDIAGLQQYLARWAGLSRSSADPGQFH